MTPVTNIVDCIFISSLRSLHMEQQVNVYDISCNSNARIQSIALLKFISSENGGGAGKSATCTLKKNSASLIRLRIRAIRALRC